MHKCASCGYTAEEMGQCPSCNVDLVAEETTVEETAPKAEAAEAVEKAASEAESAKPAEEAAPAEGEASEEVSEEPKEEGSAM